MNKSTYKWFYDNIHSRYYNLMIKWCFLPFGGEEKCRRKLIESIDIMPNEKVLDMCCGTGGATCSILEKAGDGSRTFGIDLSSGQLRIAKRNPKLRNVMFLEGDAERAAFENCSFDKVFIAHALHEMKRVSRLRVLAEARRMLKENGEIVILEVDNPKSLLVRMLAGLWLFYWLPLNPETATRRDMFRRGLSNEVREAGFEKVIKPSMFRGALQTVQGVKQTGAFSG